LRDLAFGLVNDLAHRLLPSVHDTPLSLLPQTLLDLTDLFVNFAGYLFIGTFSFQLRIIVGCTYCHPTSCPVFLPLFFQVFPEVVFVAAEPSPEVVFVAVAAVADIAEPRVSVDIAVAFVALVPVSVVVVEVDSSGRPKFLAFPNVDHFASSSSSVEVVG
jgi:hypothetical protein